MSKRYLSNSWDWDYYWLFEDLSQSRIRNSKDAKLAETMAATFKKGNKGYFTYGDKNKQCVEACRAGSTCTELMAMMLRNIKGYQNEYWSPQILPLPTSHNLQLPLTLVPPPLVFFWTLQSMSCFFPSRLCTHDSICLEHSVLLLPDTLT